VVSIRQGLLGLAIGVAGGILAGVVLAPKRKPISDGNIPGEGGGGFSGPFLSRIGGGRGLLPDEQITERLRSDLLRQGTGSRIDVTTVDGVVYLRGKEPDPIKADEAVAAAYAISGVRDVIDEIRREA
jgi:hypothetical protein